MTNNFTLKTLFVQSRLGSGDKNDKSAFSTKQIPGEPLEAKGKIYINVLMFAL